MIDGGFGEISRCQYLNRIAVLGKSSLRGGDVEGLLRLMRVERGRIFLPEIQALMEREAASDLRALISTMPPVEEVGIGNFVDLLAVRMRVPNFGAPEQQRLDCALLNFMPLVQPSFLRTVFAMDVRFRESGRIYREYIRSHAPQLTQIPLVKGGSTYRFGLPLLAVHAVTLMKRKAGMYYRDRSTGEFLGAMKEYVQDLAGSAEVSTCPYYDVPAIRKAVQAHYAGVPGHAGTVHWWLTFELWRRGLRGE